MKKRYTLSALFVLLSLAVNAQLTGITPNQGVHMQTLQTTITSNGLFIQSSSPGGNIYDIKLTKGGDVIMVFEYWNWNTNINIVDANTVTIDMTIPYSVGAGVYDLGVTVGDVWDPTWNQTFYSLPGAFTVLPPDGYVTGTVYNDLNKDGIKDAGEPGISGQTVKLLPINYTLYSDINGNYSFPISNGNYSVASFVSSSWYLFLTTPNDTLPVTVNNNTAANNDFGYKHALTSITPSTGYRGISTTHQLVADEPIFAFGAGQNGNVTQFRVFSSPTVSLNAATSVTVIDAYTIQAVINIPANVTTANNLDIRVYTTTGFVGYHFLMDQFNIVTPPAFVSGTLFFDQNQNKINDTGEPKLSGGKLVMTPDGSTAFSDNFGNYLLGSLLGPQTLTYMNNLTGLVLFTDSASYTFNATPGNITGKDFGFLSTQPDYSIQIKYPSLFARCNSQQYAYFGVRNTSNIFYNAKAWIKFSSNMTFISSTLPTTVSNDTVYWDLTNMAPYTQIQLMAKFQLPGAGSTVNLNYGASSLDGSNTVQLTNSAPASYQVFCAWDPNDKQVTPPGIFSQNYTLMTDTLEYLIRFQNTGNDTAFNVVVLDTLDNNLDFNTFEILGSSHSMQTELESNGALRFTFNNILLVDSNANEPESHGYIRYRIRANTGLPDGTPVNNTAHIYFDFNPAVVTNTTLNTMVYVLPVGIDETGNVAIRVLLYPNPFNQSATLSFDNPGSDKFILSLSEITGKNVAPDQSTSGSQFVIEKNNLSKGIYFYNLKNTVTNKFFTGKFIVE